CALSLGDSERLGRRVALAVHHQTSAMDTLQPRIAVRRKQLWTPLERGIAELSKFLRRQWNSVRLLSLSLNLRHPLRGVLAQMLAHHSLFSHCCSCAHPPQMPSPVISNWMMPTWRAGTMRSRRDLAPWILRIPWQPSMSEVWNHRVLECDAL